MIKKIICLFLIIAISPILSACTFNPSVEDLLVAPSLSDEQLSVLNALEAGRSNRISFVYPLTGSNRSAIQKYDIDSDGEDEIIAFYKVVSESLNAYISILEKNEDNSYYVSSTSEGFGDSINSVFYLSSLVAEDAVLIEWISPSKSSNTVSVYTYIDSQLEIGFEENSLDMIVLDLDNSDSFEFCYIVPATADSSYSLKYVQSNETTIFSRSQYNLNQDVAEIVSLQTGHFKNDVNALFIDESTATGYQTEVFTLSEDNSRLTRAEIGDGIDLLKLSYRTFDSRLICTDFNNNTCIPSSISPNSEVLHPDKWVYWYTVDDNAVVFENPSYYSDELGFLLSFPASWLPYCDVIRVNDNTYEIWDEINEQLIVSIVLLSVDDDIMDYVKEGYYLVGTNGTSRYYMFDNDISSKEESFITKSFKVYS